VTGDTSTASAALPREDGGARRHAAAGRRYGSWIPTWGLIATKHLELRRRRTLMVVVVLLTVGLPVLVLGLRLLFHLADPKSYGPAGSPATTCRFSGLEVIAKASRNRRGPSDPRNRCA